MHRGNYLSEGQKRQRVGSMAAVGVSALGLLPREVSLVETFEHFGVCWVEESLAVGWVLRESHLFVWKHDTAKRHASEAVRLAVPGFHSQRKWFFTAFSVGEEDIGVLLASDDGQVLCWPCIANTVPSQMVLELQSSVICAEPFSIRESAGMVLGTKSGDLYLVWISSSDLCLRQSHLYSPAAGEGKGSGVATFVGRLFGFGASSAATPGPSNADDDLVAGADSSAAVKYLSAVRGPGDTLFVFVLRSDSSFDRFDVDMQSMRTEKGWRVPDLIALVRDKIGRRSVELVVENVLSCSADTSRSFLVGVVRTPNGLALYEIRDILSDSAPHLGRASSELSLPSLKECRLSTVAYSSISEPGGVVFVVVEEEDNLLVFASRDFSPWQQNVAHGVVTGWFAVEAARGQGAVQAVILSETCLLGVKYDKTVESRLKDLGIGEDREEQEDYSSSRSIERKSSSSRQSSGIASSVQRLRTNTSAVPARMQGSGLDETEAKNVLRRVILAFQQATAKGSDGISVARDDKDWDRLLATKDENLREALRALAAKELDRSPNQRWADQAGSQSESNQSVLSFVHRHLVSKASRFGSPDGLIGFLDKSGLLGRLSKETITILYSCAHRLAGAIRLCEFHTQLDGEPREILESLMSSIALERLKSKSRQDVQKEKLEHQLVMSGLSLLDLFYSNVSDIEELVKQIPQELIAETERDSSTFKTLICLNMATLRLVSTTRGQRGLATLGSILDLPNTAVEWHNPEALWTAVETLIEINWSLLKWLKFQRVGADALLDIAALTDCFLDNAYTDSFVDTESSTARQEFLEKKILPFLEVTDIGEESVVLVARQSALRLSEKHVCHMGIISCFADVENVEILTANLYRAVSTKLCLKDDAEASGFYEILNGSGVPLHCNLGSGKWRVKRWVLPSGEGSDGDEMVRWSLRHESGPLYLSVDENGMASVVERESNEITEHEMFEIINYREGERDMRFLKSWDGQHIVEFAEDGSGCSTITRREDWALFPEKVFDWCLKHDKGYLILDFVESGRLNEELESFLTSHANETGPKRDFIQKLCWLNEIRLTKFGQAGATLENTYGTESSLAMSLAKLCRHVA